MVVHKVIAGLENVTVVFYEHA